jgi:putative transposase
MEKNLQKLNQHDRLRLWTERVAACLSSGIQVRQWFRDHGVNEKTYYYWQRRV